MNKKIFTGLLITLNIAAAAYAQTESGEVACSILNSKNRTLAHANAPLYTDNEGNAIRGSVQVTYGGLICIGSGDASLEREGQIDTRGLKEIRLIFIASGDEFKTEIPYATAPQNGIVSATVSRQLVICSCSAGR